MNASPLIDIQQISYTYPLQNKGKSKAQSPKALQDVSLQIQPGEYLAVLGHKQMLAIASVLALRPQCIIADEATSQLDPLSRREITALLHQLNQDLGLTIIHVTHLLEEAALAQRVVIMEQGRIVMEGTPSTIFTDSERLRRLKLAIPEPIELVSRLRAAGLTLSREALTVDAIVREIVR